MSVVDIRQTVSRKRRFESKPLVELQRGFENREIIVGIVGNEYQRLTNAFALEKTIGSKTLEELNKMFVFALIDGAQVDGFEHPAPFFALKIVLLNHLGLHVNPFHLNRFERRVTYDVHVFFLVEKQCVIGLPGKQIVVFPETLFNLRGYLTVVVRQRKYRPLMLKLIIGRISVNEVVERLVGLRGYRSGFHGDSYRIFTV